MLLSKLLKRDPKREPSKARDRLFSPRLFATFTLVFVVLLATWMGTDEGRGGYFVNNWALPTFILAALALLVAVSGPFGGTKLRWSILALGLFAAFTAWTGASLLWAANRGDAWEGAGQTLLYLLAFWVAMALITLGASRRWVLAASALAPAAVAALTLSDLAADHEGYFYYDRLYEPFGYHNGEAAFLLVPLWVAVYLGGSRSVNPLVRGAVLAGTVLCADLAVLTQSRGAMVALIVSTPVFFLFSGQRLRGLFALAPVALALYIAFPDLNEVYAVLSDEKSPVAALEQALPTVWLSAAGAGLYGLLWGIADRSWRPPAGAVRVFGAIVFAACVVALAFGALAFTERFGDPVAWGEQRWEAFKNDEMAGQEQSRYLAASGSGRYTLWKVAWEDFERHPLIGVGTHNYEATYFRLREKDVGIVRQPHSLPLEVLAERGIVGGILFFGFLAACVAAGLWKRFTSLRSEGKALVGALVAAAAYWFVHSTAEWFWQLPAVTLPAIVYLAMLASPWSGLDEAEPKFIRWPLRALGAALAVVAVVAVAPLYLSDRYLAQSAGFVGAREGMLGAGLRASLPKVERAQELNPLDHRLFWHEGKRAAMIGARDRAEEAYRHAIRLNPEHFQPYNVLARFYEARGENKKALLYYREAQERNPLDQSIKQSVERVESKKR